MKAGGIAVCEVGRERRPQSADPMSIISSALDELHGATTDLDRRQHEQSSEKEASGICHCTDKGRKPRFPRARQKQHSRTKHGNCEDDTGPTKGYPDLRRIHSEAISSEKHQNHSPGRAQQLDAVVNSHATLLWREEYSSIARSATRTLPPEPAIPAQHPQIVPLRQHRPQPFRAHPPTRCACGNDQLDSTAI